MKRFPRPLAALFALALILPAISSTAAPTYKPFISGSLTATGDSQQLYIANCSVVSFVLTGNAASFSVTFKTSTAADPAVTASYVTNTNLGASGVATANGTYTGAVGSFGLQWAKLTVTAIGSGTLTYYATCTSAAPTTVAVTGAPTPIPFPTSSPGNAQIVVPANASAAPYTAANPLPVTTPAPQASIIVNQGTSPFVVSTPAPAPTGAHGATIVEGVASGTVIPVTTPAPAPTDASGNVKVAMQSLATVTATGTISAGSSDCSVANSCIPNSSGLALNGSQSCYVATSGSLGGQQNFEAKDPNGNWVSIAGMTSNFTGGTTGVANGTNSYSFYGLSPYSAIRLRVASYTSGTPTVTISCGIGGGAPAAFIYASNGLPLSNTNPGDSLSPGSALSTTAFLEGFNGTNQERVRTSPLRTGLIGTVSDSTGVTAPVVCDKSASVNISTATTTSIVALSGSTKIYVCGYDLYVVSGTTPGFKFVHGPGAACVTTPVDFSGVYGGIAGAVGTRFEHGTGVGAVLTTAAGDAFCITSSGTTPNIQGYIQYAQF